MVSLKALIDFDAIALEWGAGRLHQILSRGADMRDARLA
jgi:hypothetical protein